MGMRPTAGLHVPHIPRMSNIADVEDPKSPEPFLTDSILEALGAAVEPRGQVLARDKEQVAIHRSIALRAGADVGRFQLGLPGIADIPDLIAVEAALHRVMPG